MYLSGAEIIVQFLERQGIKTVAGIPGGMILPLYDALSKSNIRHILARHEQGAGFIAHGMARSTGKAAVCLATSGPGVTNLVTAIADAKMDSVPLVAITGQINYSQIGSDAFQEVDTYGLTLPVTKHNFLVRSARELLRVLPEAFDLAESGRPGPVIIDVPKDVQLEKIRFGKWTERRQTLQPITEIPSLPMIPEPSEDILKAVDMISKAKRPALFIGGGVIQANASELIRKLAAKCHLPVATTLMGLGAFPSDHPLFMGLIGMHGSMATNRMIHEADLIIALGVRFDDRATGDVKQFCMNAAILHIDIDPSEINKNKEVHLSITMDLNQALWQLIRLLPETQETTDLSGKPGTPNNSNALNTSDPSNEERLVSRDIWIERIAELRHKDPFYGNHSPIHPLGLIQQISRMVPADTIVTTDVGQHQMWTAQAYPFKNPRTLLTSGGLGTMGFGLPTALGAALANPDKTVVCISGDGSILMNLQEMATMADIQPNLKLIILNNHMLGMVRQIQQHFYKENYMAVQFESNPDFALIAQGFGLSGHHLDTRQPYLSQLKALLEQPGPMVINIAIPADLNVLPIVPPGSANHHAIV